MSAKAEIRKEIKILVGKLASGQDALDRAYDRLVKAERNLDKVAVPYYEMEDRVNCLKKKLKKKKP